MPSAHITSADGNVFADLGFSPKEAKAMLIDADARIAKCVSQLRKKWHSASVEGYREAGRSMAWTAS